MVLKFTKEQFKSGLQKAIGSKPLFKAEKALKEAGLEKLLHQPSVSKDQFRKAINALRKEGVAYKQAGEVIRETERKITSLKPAEKPKEKMSIAEIRKKMKEEEEKKEKMRKMMAEIYQRERARETEKGGMPSGTPTTSALRKGESSKPQAEEKPKPKVIDLPID